MSLLRRAATALLVPPVAAAPPAEVEPTVTDADVLASAKEACAEIRRQVDHQVRDAELVDTKGSALLTLTATVVGLLATRLRLDNGERIGTALLAAVLVFLIFACCVQAVRPRGGFSYGADAAPLVALVDAHAHVTVMLSLADSLRDAREKNVRYLQIKQDWLQTALVLAVLGIVSIGWLVRVGGVT